MSAERSARAVRRTDGLDPLQALQRVLYRSAKQDRSRRFHALYDKLTRSDVMWRAWCDVAANRGAPGVDGVSIDAVCADGVQGVKSFLGELAARVRDGSYRPAPLRRVYIPKPGQPGKQRPLSIPTVADRVVMTAAKLVLEPIFGSPRVSVGELSGLRTGKALWGRGLRVRGGPSLVSVKRAPPARWSAGAAPLPAPGPSPGRGHPMIFRRRFARNIIGTHP